MKIYDHTQNLGIRVGTIQIIAFVLLSILGARLYYLQVVKGEYYDEKAENQRIRLIPIQAAGRTAPRFHAHARPMLVEREATHRAISLAELVDVPILIVQSRAARRSRRSAGHAHMA